MNPSEQRAIVTLSLMAAFADGDKHDRERAEVRRIAESLSGADGLNLPALVQEVLMKRVTLASVCESLAGTEARQLAFEMAVGVCDADGAQSPAEQRFLAELKTALGLGAAADDFARQAEAVAEAPLHGGAAVAVGVANLATLPDAASAPADSLVAPVPGAMPPSAVGPDAADLQKSILDAAILNGALELLPESLSTMAIIPLQMRMVYRIGQAHGFELDRGHIKDFLATVGVGLTSQYLEQAGRKLLGGLLGRVGGGLLGGVVRQAVSSGMSFAATYALGHVAWRYYAGGRTLSTDLLKQAYAGLAQEAQGLQGRYLPAMQEKARTLDLGQLLASVRGR